MRSSAPLAWLAVLPLVAACASEAGEPRGPNDVPSAARPDVPGGPSSDSQGPPAAPGSTACILQPKCDGATSPQLGAKRSFVHTISSVTAASGPAFHRGRDQIYAVGDAQWVIGKMAYTYADKDLKDEDVDVFVERGCGGAWEKLGSVRTTPSGGTHPTVESVADSGGRVFFQIPKAKELPAGRHRVRLVVTADQTSTDLLIDIVPKGSPIVVSDVDGTLTTSENAEFPALLTGSLPDAHPDAAAALSTLASKGYHVVYLTARPEWLTGRTREFLATAGFPTGIVHTTTGVTGAVGAAAASYKSDELSMLLGHGHQIAWGFGNKASDTDAYDAAKISPVDHRVFLQVDDAHGGRRIESYTQLLPVLSAVPPVCK